MAPLIVITGPTASGKSSLALELAESYNGEIICADSRTIFKGMDIGTAKPTREEQTRVIHSLLDIVEPGQRYTAANFQADALAKIEQTRRQGKVPFLVGGTGLYIDAVVREYEWPAVSDNVALLRQHESKTVEELQSMIKTQQLPMPYNKRNKRHLISTLIRQGKQGSARALPRESTHVVAIATDKEELETCMRERATVMFRQGLIEETKQLAGRYGWESEAMKSNVYPIVRQVIDGSISEHEAVELIVTKDKQLAKRQITWLKRHDYVSWLNLEDARAHIETILG